MMTITRFKGKAAVEVGQFLGQDDTASQSRIACVIVIDHWSDGISGQQIKSRFVIGPSLLSSITNMGYLYERSSRSLFLDTGRARRTTSFARAPQTKMMLAWLELTKAKCLACSCASWSLAVSSLVSKWDGLLKSNVQTRTLSLVN